MGKGWDCFAPLAMTVNVFVQLLIKDFKDLQIWQKGMDIAEKCYLPTKLFPKEELYGMVQQIRRSSASIPANIAEGYGRRSPRDSILLG